jgi:hypothetical protein
MAFRTDLVPVEDGEETLAETWNYGAGEIDLAIAGHEQLNRFQAGIMGGKGAALVHIFIGEVLDGMAENLQGVPCLGVDLTSAVGADFSCADWRSKNRNRNTRE